MKRGDGRYAMLPSLIKERGMIEVGIYMAVCYLLWLCAIQTLVKPCPDVSEEVLKSLDDEAEASSSVTLARYYSPKFRHILTSPAI